MYYGIQEDHGPVQALMFTNIDDVRQMLMRDDYELFDHGDDEWTEQHPEEVECWSKEDAPTVAIIALDASQQPRPYRD